MQGRFSFVFNYFYFGRFFLFFPIFFFPFCSLFFSLPSQQMINAFSYVRLFVQHKPSQSKQSHARTTAGEPLVTILTWYVSCSSFFFLLFLFYLKRSLPLLPLHFFLIFQFFILTRQSAFTVDFVRRHAPLMLSWRDPTTNLRPRLTKSSCTTRPNFYKMVTSGKLKWQRISRANICTAKKSKKYVHLSQDV